MRPYIAACHPSHSGSDYPMHADGFEYFACFQACVGLAFISFYPKIGYQTSAARAAARHAKRQRYHQL